jgi:hypothetical protein
MKNISTVFIAIAVILGAFVNYLQTQQLELQSNRIVCLEQKRVYVDGYCAGWYESN